MMKRVFATVLMAVLPTFAAAVDLDGVSIPDRQTVFGKDLSLNGAGARTAMGAKIYLAALYLPNKSQDAEVAISTPQPRRMMLVFRRAVNAKLVAGTLREGVRANVSESELEELKPALVELENALVGNLYETRPGDKMALDIAADGSVKLSYNGIPSGSLSGPSIGPALLKIWLGKTPANLALKNELLAGAQYAKAGKDRSSAFDSVFEGFSP